MKKYLSLLTAALPLLLGSCAVSTFQYPADIDDLAIVSPTPYQPYLVVVPPFQDRRLDLNRTDSLFLYLLPLCPYDYVEFYRPEKATHFTTISQFIFDPVNDPAKAAAFSLRRSNLFKDAIYAQPGQTVAAHLVFNGELLETYYKGRRFTYGFSIAGPALWVVGFPMGTSGDRLRVKFTITRPGQTQPLWEYVYEGDDWTVQWLYAQQDRDCVFFAALMQEGLNNAIRDLRSRLQRNPDLLK